MPLGEAGPHKRGGEKGAPPQTTLFYRYWLVKVKMVADRHRHAAYHNKHW